MIGSSSDPRVVRSRARLLDAVGRLAERGDPITVTAVVAEAGTSRAAFYTHFEDLAHLAFALQERAFQTITARTRTVGTTVSYSTMVDAQRALIAHYAEYRTLYVGLFAVAAPRGAHHPVVSLMASQIRTHIEEATAPPAEIDVNLAASYIAHAATGLIVAWVLGDTEATPEQVAQHLGALMPEWMHEPKTPPPGHTGGTEEGNEE